MSFVLRASNYAEIKKIRKDKDLLLALGVAIVDDSMAQDLQLYIDEHGCNSVREAVKYLTNIHYPGEEDRLSKSVARIAQRKGESVKEFYSRFNRDTKMVRKLKGYPHEGEMPSKFVAGLSPHVRKEVEAEADSFANLQA